MIPCHCPTNQDPTAAKTQIPTVFSDAEFGLLKNLLKPLQYSQQYGQKKKMPVSSTDKRFSRRTRPDREWHSCVTGSATEVLVISPSLASPDSSQQETLHFNADFQDFPYQLPIQHMQESESSCNSIKNHFTLTQLP